MRKMMKQSLLIAGLGLALGSAQLSAEVTGDAAKGKRKAAACAACHGGDGNSTAPDYPKLAGQGEKYLIKQMNDIKSGARPVALMAGQLNGKSEQDIADIAAFYASKTTTGGQADPDLVELGQSIYRGGVSERGIPACSACHGPGGAGVAAAGFPALAGQHAKYTALQLQQFRAGGDGDESGRNNDGDEVRTMRTIAFRMSDREIEAVSSYLQGLH